jgi:uncharacterized protein
MPEYLAPGVYVEEVDTGSKPIEGVSTSTSGMVGVTELGPVNVPTLVTGFADFQRQFGGYLDRRIYIGSTWYLPHAVEGFFTNGGKRLYAVRVLPPSATSARTTLFDQGETPDSSGLTFNRFTRSLSARVVQGDQLLILDDSTDVPSAGGWALLQEGRSSEYVQIVGAPAGVVAIATPITATLWATGTVVEGLDATSAVLGTTALIADVSQGEFLLPVANASVWGGAVTYRIGDAADPARESHAQADNGAVALSAPLALNHNLNAPVHEPGITVDSVARTLTADVLRGTIQIRLDNRSGILNPPPLGNQVHFLQLTNSAGDLEFVRIDGVETPRIAGADPGNITLEWALQRDYATGDTVTLLVDTDADTNPTSLAWDADPDDRALVLGDSGAYGAGSFIRTEAITAANAEYNQVLAGSSPTLRIAATPFRASHPAATPALGRSQLLTVQAIDPGVWGNKLRVLVDRESSPLLRETQPTAPVPATSPTLTLRTTVGIEPGSVLEFFTRNSAGVETVVFQQKAFSVAGNVVVFGAGGLAQAVPVNTLVRTVEFQMTIELVKLNPVTQQEEGIVTNERFRQLSLDARHPRYVVRVIGRIFVDDVTTPRRADGRTEGESLLIRVVDALTPAQTETTLRTVPDILHFTPPGGQPRLFGHLFTGGNDDISAITPAVYIGSDGTNPPRSRTGIFALKNIEEIAITAVPGQTDQQIQNALLAHCELLRYRFAVLDAEPGSNLAEVQDQRSLYDSKYGALYYPWLQIPDPFPDNPRVPSLVLIPPSGHTIGIYARNDIERGVHKAPANEVIRGINDLELRLTKEEQDILNPRNINVLRNFRENNRGLRVWGARTLSSDPDWKYINVRRLFIFIENSIDRGTQWVVFEPNNELLWERVKRVISAFLTNVWRDGALMGKTPEEAYFVKVDRTTMTQNDIDNGRLIIQVGIAPVKPAEFVIFRIGQWVGGSELEEG